jgi:hypothetical protein
MSVIKVTAAINRQQTADSRQTDRHRHTEITNLPTANKEIAAALSTDDTRVEPFLRQFKAIYVRNLYITDLLDGRLRRKVIHCRRIVLSYNWLGRFGKHDGIGSVHISIANLRGSSHDRFAVKPHKYREVLFCLTKCFLHSHFPTREEFVLSPI